MLEIISRSAWEALEPLNPIQLREIPNNVFMSYSRQEPCSGYDCLHYLRREQVKHIRIKKHSDLSYSFLIDEDGRIYEGRGASLTPSLPMKYKYLERCSLLIVALGTFSDEPPPDKMFEAREEFLQYCVKQEFITSDYRSIVI
ncbi:peptidoglycan recognition protein 3-like [Macrosteles quadrilineatus]|uniref:peptidoglycan recognition protein 3-like n=1 Tax=Macrosteles quadrilineatus TaxID=74068 RepID=UPI0023E15FDE|nr:peptidoglycan recognition protein 3-like [Macrosteles quadrilineatus]